eukprot:gene11170-12454_t
MKWVVIGLAEDILITSITLANYEKYSSMIQDFQLLASTTYPPSTTLDWLDLGIYRAEPRLGEQTFNITRLADVHTRFLKVKFLTHYMNEELCTLSQIKVHGVTIIDSLKQEVEKSQDHLQMLRNEEDLSSSSTSTTITTSSSSLGGSQVNNDSVLQGENLVQEGHHVVEGGEGSPVIDHAMPTTTLHEEQQQEEEGVHGALPTPMPSTIPAPSIQSSCDFHAKMVAKLQPAMTADASSAAALGSSAKENNIFRQLMQRIKNLEMNFVSDCMKIVSKEAQRLITTSTTTTTRSTAVHITSPPSTTSSSSCISSSSSEENNGVGSSSTNSCTNEPIIVHSATSKKAVGSADSSTPSTTTTTSEEFDLLYFIHKHDPEESMKKIVSWLLINIVKPLEKEVKKMIIMEETVLVVGEGRREW